MPFGLTNTLITFQAYINKVLLSLLDTIYIIYLNDIIVYFNNYKTHTHYIRIVLKKTAGIQALYKPKKIYILCY